MAAEGAEKVTPSLPETAGGEHPARCVPSAGALAGRRVEAVECGELPVTDVLPPSAAATPSPSTGPGCRGLTPPFPGGFTEHLRPPPSNRQQVDSQLTSGFETAPGLDQGLGSKIPGTKP